MKRSNRSMALYWAAGLLIAGSLAVAVWLVLEANLVRTVYRLGDVRLEGGRLKLRKVVWEPAAPLPLGEATGVTVPDTDDLAASLLLAAPSARGDQDLFYRLRTRDGWSPPLPLGLAGGALNSPADEVSPFFDPATGTLYFASDRSGGLGGFDLWSAERDTEAATGDDGAFAWSKPRNLGRRVNSPYDDREPTTARDGALLIFSTNRPANFLLAPPDWETISVERWRAADHNLAFSRRQRTATQRSRWTLPAPVEAANTAWNERAPAFSPAADFLYFASDRGGGAGGFDLLRGRADFSGSGSPFVERVENLGPGINSPGNESLPLLGHGGFEMLYRTDVAPAAVETRPVPGRGGVWVRSEAREVEEELEIAALPLAAWSRHLGRIIVLAASALAVVLVAILLYRTRQNWAVNLLTRCAVLAVALHLAMLYGFYFWKLGRRIFVVARQETVEEVSLERTLSASIAMEVNRRHAEVPEPTPRATSENASRRRVDVRAVVSRTPATRPAEVDPAASNSEVEVVESVAVHRPRVAREAGEMTPVEEMPAAESPAQSLPQVEPRPSETEAGESPSREVVRLTLDERVRENAALTAREVQAESARSSEVTSVALAAATPVLAPRPSPMLPAVGSTANELEVEVKKLPVPAQSPQVSPEEPTPAPRSARRSRPRASALARADTSNPATSPTRLLLPSSLKDSIPSGLPAATTPLAAAREVPEAPLVPTQRTYPTARTRRLPEVTALAERRAESEAPRVAKLERPAVTAARRKHSLDESRPTLLRSPVATAEARPLTFSREASRPVSSAALARLEPAPSPGALRPLESAVRRPSRPAERPRLPEAGATEVADVIPLRGPRKSRRPSPAIARRLADERPPRQASPRETPVAPAARPAVTGSAAAARLRKTVKPAASGTPRAVRLAKAAEAARESAETRLPERTPDLPRPQNLGELRSSDTRKIFVARMGGSDESEAAVARALEWLARHQAPNGSWDVDHFDDRCQGCRSPGFQVDCDVAITALAALCFLGQNHTPRSGPYARTISRALTWLTLSQTPDGNLAGPDTRYTMYSHGIATLALSEAYILTRNERFLAPLRRAVDLVIRTQNRVTGGWRYRPVRPLRGDTSITGWQVLALHSAANAGLTVPEAVFDRCRHWLDEEVGGGQHGGIYGYTRVDEPRVAMTAEGMFARQLLGARRGDANIEEAARYIHAKTRDGTHLDNLYLLYYGTLALYQYQGWIWERWNRQVSGFLLAQQHRSGPLAGSWDPAGPWSEAGGRVLSTAFATLTLEVYYRYLPMYWAPGEIGSPSASRR